MSKIKKRQKIVNDQTLLVTVDVGKNKNTAQFRYPDGSEQMPLEFSNNHQGFEKFYVAVRWWKHKKNLTQIVVGFESTGPYAEPLLHFLKPKKVKLVQVNTAHTKKLKEVYDNSPGKTDKKDPGVIADIIELGRHLTVIIPEGIIAELRRLIHARERYIDHRTALVNQLQDLVYLVFPEFHRIFPRIQSKTAQFILSDYPAPEDIVKLRESELTVLLRKKSRGRIGESRAQELLHAANRSVGLKEGKESILKEIKNILKAISQYNEFIDDCEKDVSQGLLHIGYAKNILSIKGIGEITVAGLIGEVADFSRFKTSAEVEKLAGLNLFEISSGRYKGIKRISKHGRPLMRKLLFYATLNLVRKGHTFHEKYQTYLDRGMPKMKALIAIARKLLRVIFALVRDQSRFDIEKIGDQRIEKAA